MQRFRDDRERLGDWGLGRYRGRGKRPSYEEYIFRSFQGR